MSFTVWLYRGAKKDSAYREDANFIFGVGAVISFLILCVQLGLYLKARDIKRECDRYERYTEHPTRYVKHSWYTSNCYVTAPNGEIFELEQYIAVLGDN
jgi:hypothetical protein